MIFLLRLTKEDINQNTIPTADHDVNLGVRLKMCNIHLNLRNKQFKMQDNDGTDLTESYD
jgi:hypothetical protein